MLGAEIKAANFTAVTTKAGLLHDDDDDASVAELSSPVCRDFSERLCCDA